MGRSARRFPSGLWSESRFSVLRCASVSSVLQRACLWASIAGVALAACSEHDPEIGHVGGTGAVGGTGSGGSAGAACVVDTSFANPAYPCEILAIVQPKCQRCHQDPQLNGAPFSLLTFPDTQKLYVNKVIYQRMHNAVDTDFMPFCAQSCANNYDPPVQKLTPEEKQTLLDWLVCPQPVDGDTVTCP